MPSRIHRAVACLGLACLSTLAPGLTGPALAGPVADLAPTTGTQGTLGAPGADMALTPDQARALAAQMLVRGQPEITVRLALGLIRRNPRDASAHFLLARAYQHLGHRGPAHREAVRAYRSAGSGPAHFHSAQLAAKLAHEQGRPGLAQLWLRRSWNHAPDDRAREVLMRDYRVLRAINPWDLRLRLSIQPSDNVNNGAEDPYAVIEGLPLIGQLSGDALALSGVKMTSELTMGYRLAHSARSQTRLGGQLYLSRVALSDRARRIAPTARNGDYAYSRAELTLSHIRALGREGASLSVTGGLSHSRYGGEAYQDGLRLGVVRRLPLGPARQLSLQAQIDRSRPASGAPDITRLDLRGQLSHSLTSGATLAYGLSLDITDSATLNQRRQRASAFVTYAPAQPLGPARLSFSLGGAISQHPDYMVGFFAVPGGREDRMIFGSADFVFETLDYGGFVPSLKIQAQRTQSNVSRFETRELSVSMGIVSRF